MRKNWRELLEIERRDGGWEGLTDKEAGDLGLLDLMQEAQNLLCMAYGLSDHNERFDSIAKAIQENVIGEIHLVGLLEGVEPMDYLREEFKAR